MTQQQRRSARVEKLEDRHLLAAVSGEVFLDGNADGIRQAGETTVPGVVVYLDDNNNARRDPGEGARVTDGDGIYTFPQLIEGEYRFRVDPGPGRVQSAPQSAYGVDASVLTDEVVRRAWQVFTIDATGVTSFIGAPSTNRLEGLVQLADGDLLGANLTTNTVFRINPNNGEQLSLSTNSEDMLGGLAYDPVGDTVYTLLRTTQDPTLLQLATVDSNTGLVTVVGPGYSGLSTVTDLAYDAVNERIIGFDDNDDEFFAFNLAGVGQTLSRRELIFGVQGQQPRSIDADGMAIAPPQLVADAGLPAGTYVWMFDDDNDAMTATFLVNVDTYGSLDVETGETVGIDDSIDSDTAVNLAALTRPSTGNVAYTFSVDQFETRNGIDFGLTEDVIGFRARPGQPPSGPGAIAYEGLTVVGGAVGNDVVEITLNRRPETDVVLNLTTSTQLGGPTGVLLSDSQLVFTPDDWDQPRLVTLSPDVDNPPVNILAVSLTISVDQPVTDPEWRTLRSRVLPVRVLPPVQEIDFSTPVINELLVEANFASRFSETNDQIIELRGQPGQLLPQGTYFVVVNENFISTGEIDTVIDLSGQSFGSNGMLVLQQPDSDHSVSPFANVLQSTTTGFLGLPGGIATSNNANGTLNSTFDSAGYFLIQSDTPPVVGADIDADNDGLPDAGGVFSSWNVYDAISMHRFVGSGVAAYSPIVAIEDFLNSNSRPAAAPGTVFVVLEGYGYAGRLGDSVGSQADDWVFGEVDDVGASFFGADRDDPNLYELANELPSQPALFDRALDHFGESNFTGGVRGTVLLRPSEAAIANGVDPDTRVPGEGVTVLADTNGNGVRDDLVFVVEPDDAVPPFDINNPLPADATFSLTNFYPGVTIMEDVLGSAFLRDNIQAERQRNFLTLSGNRIFSRGFDWFTDSSRLRFDFYRPVQSVSIDAIGNEFTSIGYGNLVAYDINGQIIATAQSQPLANSRRETITLTAPGEQIVRVEAFSGDGPLGGSPFGRFDRLTYVQSEPTAVTDQNGLYEIDGLFPGDFEVQVLDGGGAGILVNQPPTPIQVNRYENFIVDYVLQPNTDPVALDDAFVIDENPPVLSLVGQVPATDLDVNAGLTFEFIGGNVAGFQIDPTTGVITVADSEPLDFELQPVRIMTVRITDALQSTTTSRVTVALRDVNEAPIVADEPLLVTEDTPPGTAIGAVSAVDPDASLGQELRFQVVGGDGASQFSIDSITGVVTMNDPAQLDFEQTNRLTLRVEVSDTAFVPSSSIVDQEIVILNVNDPPALEDTAFTLPENLTGTLLTLQVLDPDVGQNHAFQFDQSNPGTAANLLTVLPDGRITVNEGVELDFETQPNLSLGVIVSDDGAPSIATQETITITLNNVDEPARLLSQEFSIEERPGLTNVGTLTLIDNDSDPAQSQIQILPGPSSDLFEISLATGSATAYDLTLAAGTVLDHETQSTYSLDVEIASSNPQVPVVTETITINVTDINEGPQIVTDELIVSEIPGAGDLIGRVIATDPEDDDLTFQIIGGNQQANFTIDAETGDVRVAPGVVFEADDLLPPDLTLEVRASDQDDSVDQVISLKLNNVNEPPVFDDALAQTLDPQAATSGQLFELTLPDGLASDPEGADFDYRVYLTGTDPNLRQLPSWLSYDATTQTLSGRPSPADRAQAGNGGVVDLTVRAIELGPFPLAAEVNFTITIGLGDAPFRNGAADGPDRFDVDANGEVAALDALRIINYLAANGSELDPDSVDAFSGYVDVNGDNQVTALDALQVINEINSRQNGGGIASEPLDDRDERAEAVDAVLTSEIGTGLF
ncbi:MAG: cadherin domain-containing protein [Planctomycetota bacterium]